MILGNDLSGIVVECGKDVSQFHPGDLVFGMIDPNPVLAWNGFTQCGAYAEFAVARADTLAHKPESISHVEAASIPLVALTAYQALGTDLKNKDVLINGASGGVGTFAVQLARAAGARVTAFCSEPNREAVRDLGAREVYDYRKQSVTDLPGQFDVIYDVAVTLKYSECHELLKPDGRFISNLISPSNFLSTILQPALKPFCHGRINTYAFVKPSGQELEEISKLIELGHIRPVIDRVFDLQDVAAAHEHSQKSRGYGKVVLNVAENRVD